MSLRPTWTFNAPHPTRAALRRCRSSKHGCTHRPRSQAFSHSADAPLSCRSSSDRGLRTYERCSLVHARPASPSHASTASPPSSRTMLPHGDSGTLARSGAAVLAGCADSMGRRAPSTRAAASAASLAVAPRPCGLRRSGDPRSVRSCDTGVRGRGIVHPAQSPGGLRARAAAASCARPGVRRSSAGPGETARRTRPVRALAIRRRPMRDSTVLLGSNAGAGPAHGVARWLPASSAGGRNESGERIVVGASPSGPINHPAPPTVLPLFSLPHPSGASSLRPPRLLRSMAGRRPWGRGQRRAAADRAQRPRRTSACVRVRACVPLVSARAVTTTALCDTTDGGIVRARATHRRSRTCVRGRGTATRPRCASMDAPCDAWTRGPAIGRSVDPTAPFTGHTEHATHRHAA